jgi:site-specific DNA-methyltransferase (adenine-specific)
MDDDYNPVAKGGLRAYNGYAWDFKEVAKQLYRVTKPGGVVVWVIGDPTINGSESLSSSLQKIYFRRVGFNIHDTMIYRKINGAIGSALTYLQEFEFMLVLSKGQIGTVNLLRDRKNVITGNKTTPIQRSNRLGSLKERKIIERKMLGRRKNIWDYAVGGKQEMGYHPAPFPEALAHDHILSWSHPGDVVLDPFAGSGTTLKMAKELGRHWIGIEISQEYVDTAHRRLAGTDVPMPGLVGI